MLCECRASRWAAARPPSCLTALRSNGTHNVPSCLLRFCWSSLYSVANDCPVITKVLYVLGKLPAAAHAQVCELLVLEAGTRDAGSCAAEPCVQPPVAMSLMTLTVSIASVTLPFQCAWLFCG